jgi:hypothetical protein
MELHRRASVLTETSRQMHLWRRSMRDVLRRINARHHEALSRLFVVQVAFVAACYLVNMDGPRERSGWFIFLSFFIWPLMAAWPARRGRMLRGAVTNALAIILTVMYFIYFEGGIITADWLRLLTILAFGIMSGMAAGGLVERRRSRLRAVSEGLPLSVQLPPLSITAFSSFGPAASDFGASEHTAALPTRPSNAP